MDSPFRVNYRLKSLLALSVGAVSLPHAGTAGIVYSGPIDEQVGFSPGFNSSYTLDLPGTADVQLVTKSFPGVDYGPSFQYGATNRVNFSQGSGYARFRIFSSNGNSFIKRNSAGLTWDAIGGNTGSVGAVGLRDSSAVGSVQGPGSFVDKYAAFEFQDSTQGNADRYGWALLSMTVAPGVGPDVTLQGYAYDDSGAEIPMGAVPEPSAAALAALGALALGGVRRWRASKKRAA